MFYKLNVQFSDEFLNSKITILCCCSTFNYLNLFFFYSVLEIFYIKTLSTWKTKIIRLSETAEITPYIFK